MLRSPGEELKTIYHKDNNILCVEPSFDFRKVLIHCIKERNYFNEKEIIVDMNKKE